MEKVISMEEAMGKRKVVDKTIRPTTTLTSLTPALVTAGQNQGLLGNIPIGVYKGSAAFWDLDLAVNQPNVLAEQQHILGILSGREAGYDLVTVTAAAAAAAGTLLSGSLTVPTGELWYVNAISMICPGDATAGFTLNWYCDLWTDRVGALGFGQPFHGPVHALAGAVDAGNALATHVAPGGGAINQLDEFGPIATAWNIANKVPVLRLPPGTIITFTVLPDTAAVTVATACTLGVFGAVGKALVA